MYTVKRHNRKVGKFFNEYDVARQWVRKQIRRDAPPESSARRSCVGEVTGWWDDISRNPPRISHFGYKIIRV